MSNATTTDPSVSASPSWKLVAKARRQFGMVNPSTPSMGRAVLVRQSSMEQPGLGGSFVILRPLESNVYPRTHQSLKSTRTVEQKSGRPFLTLALLKLAQVLPEFLENMATPTPSSVANACALMESMATPRSDGPLLQRNERPVVSPPPPKSFKDSNTSLFQPLELLQQMIRGASPVSSRSPSPFASPSDSPLLSLSNPSSPSALALEKEWERLVAGPFWLFAAAEILTADCCRDSNLNGLYKRCTQDLFRLQQLLCEPVLVTKSSQPDVLAAAEKVQILLDAMLVFISAQSEFVRIQSCLHQFTTDPEILAQAATGMEIVLARLDTIGDLSISLLFQRAYQQAQGWKDALEACIAVDQCLFLESIVYMRKWQHAVSSLEKTGETRQTLWLGRCFTKVLATLPLFLDCSRVYASPLYGLVNTKFPIADDYDDLENDILEFLRRQEKLFGPPTAIAVILDAEGTSNFHPEKGFCLRSDLVHGTNIVEGNLMELQRQWPPVFVRSTLHTASFNTTNTPSLLQVAHASGTTVASPHLRRKSQEVQKLTSVLKEYMHEDKGSDIPWPHLEWETLVELLEQDFCSDDIDFDRHRLRLAMSSKASSEMARENVVIEKEEDNSRSDEVPAVAFSHDTNVSLSKTPYLQMAFPEPVTYRSTSLHDGNSTDKNDFVATDQQPSFFHLRQNASSSATTTKDTKANGGIAHPAVNIQPLEDVVNLDKTVSTTSYHLVSLSRWTTLVLMVKKDEEDTNRKHTKRQQLSDGEIHHFLNEMADKLRICRFWSQYLPESQLPIDKQTKEPIISLQRWVRSIPMMSQLDFDSTDNPKEQLYDPWMSDGRVSLFLDQVKVAFGLRSANLPMFQAMNRSTSWWWGPSSSSKNKSPKTKQRPRKKNKKLSLNDSDVMTEGAAVLFLGSSLSRFLMKDE